jgi:hypothetical protein
MQCSYCSLNMSTYTDAAMQYAGRGAGLLEMNANSGELAFQLKSVREAKVDAHMCSKYFRLGVIRIVCCAAQGGVRGLLAMGANFGELAFELESAREAEARVTRHAREIAAQLSERARKEVRNLPFPKCASLSCSVEPMPTNICPDSAAS